MRFTINLDCKNTYISKEGNIPILLRVSLNGKHDYINIGKRIPESFYNRKEKKLASKKGVELYKEFIHRHTLILTNIISDYEKKNEILSLGRLKEIYKKQTEGQLNNCFFSFVEERLKYEEENQIIKEATLENYKGSYKQLKKFKKKVSIYDINVRFMEEFKGYLKTKENLMPNTIFHAMSFMRKYTLQLVKDGLLPQNPIANFKVGNPEEVELVYVDPKELETLVKLYKSKDLLNYKRPKKSKFSKNNQDGLKMQQVLQYFLASCFTGLRYSDIKTLTTNDIKGNEIVKKMVKVRTGTTKIVRIPIIKMLREILDLKPGKKFLFDAPVFSNSHTNKYLKKIFAYTQFDRNITFHKARYTFAINSLILGVSILVISDVLGHSTLTITTRYAKIVDKIRKEEMSKWDVFGKETESEMKIVLNCSNCHQQLFETQKGTVLQNTIRCKCPNCAELNMLQVA